MSSHSISEDSLKNARMEKTYEEQKNNYDPEKSRNLDEDLQIHGMSLSPEALQTRIAQLEEHSKEEIANESFFSKLIGVEIPIDFKTTGQLVAFLGIFASFAGLLSGVDQSIISGASLGIKEWYHATEHEMSLVSSLMPMGAIAGSIMMTPLNSLCGRRSSLIISCLWYSLGAGLCAGAHSIHMLYAGRFFLGVGVGIEGGCVGIYISESVPAEKRGNIVSLYQFMLAFGEVVGYAISAIFYDVLRPGGSWRFMLGSSAIFSTILLVGLFMLPESPRWLVIKNKPGRAWLVWKRLRDVSDPRNQIEFLSMVQANNMENEEAANESVWTRWFELFTIARNRRAFIYSFMMIFFGQMTGINAVLYNLSSMMLSIGFSERDGVLLSMVGGGALWIGAIPAILFMDRFGRRVWAQNIIGFIIAATIVGAGYQMYQEGSFPERSYLGVYFFGLVAYMLFFGSYACLTWVVPSESFNMRTRAQGMSICSVFLYLWSFIVTYNFTNMEKAMTYIGLMAGFYAGLGLLGFIYQILFMPETKNRTLEEIDDIFELPTKTLVHANIMRFKNRIGWLLGRGKKENVYPKPLKKQQASQAEQAQSQSIPIKQTATTAHVEDAEGFDPI